jgi:hypothetical protein
VDDLVNHHLTKVKLLMLFLAEILRDHSNALALAIQTVPTIGHVAILVIVVIQGTDSGPLAYAAVARSSGTVVLPPEI